MYFDSAILQIFMKYGLPGLFLWLKYFMIFIIMIRMSQNGQ